MTATPRISLEFFPPQTLDASFRLWESVQALAPFDPGFVSVTCGACGSTRDRTLDAATVIRRNAGLEVAAHLTCTGVTRDEILATADELAAAGVRRIVALRGDAEKGAQQWAPHPGGFASSVELITALACDGRFEIIVGAYPEGHPDAANPAADVEYLRRKIDAGASAAITQFFFEAETFLRFRDACAAAGIAAPVIPGILPIASWEGVRGFAARCGARVPPQLEAGFARALRDGRVDLFALAHCVQLCDRLLGEGVETLHFYTLNRPDPTREVLRALGLQPGVRLERAA